MRAKETETITIRQTITLTVKIERTSENEESTTMPLIIVVQSSRRG